MNNKKIEIFCTLGPSSINSRFLKSISQKKNVSLVRLNMSHISINKLKKFIIYIRKFTNCPICIDTEGAQIRTKIKKSSYFKVNQIIKVNRSKGNFTFYPPEVFEKIRRGDILDIGFDDLKAKVIKINQKLIVCKTVSSGKLENNKGINISNRKIKEVKLADHKDYNLKEILTRQYLNWKLSGHSRQGKIIFVNAICLPHIRTQYPVTEFHMLPFTDPMLGISKGVFTNHGVSVIDQSDALNNF